MTSTAGLPVECLSPTNSTPIAVPDVPSHTLQPTALDDAGSRLPLAFETPYRFLPGGKTLITLQGTAPNQNFFSLDLETGEQRQLTEFRPEERLDDSGLRHLA